MGAVHVVKTPKVNQNWFIASDWHSFNIHQPSLNILLEFASLLPKDQRNLIINGDFIDAPYMMPKNADFQTWASRKDGIDLFFLPEFEKEMKWANETLDALQCVFNHIIFIHGNHDGPRFEEFKVKHCPVEYRDHFNMDVKMNLLKRNIGSIPYGDYIDIGDMSVTHGNYCGPSAHKKHYEAVGSRNVVFGHVHSAESKSFHIRGITRKAWSLPAMCDLNPRYIKNRDINWSNGFATMVMRPDGKFNFHTHLVIDNQLCLPTGQVLKG